MTTRVYYSTDSSAPVLANSQNSLAALLYACLVTGYGAKSGLGWTREYTGTGKAVFKAGSGSRGHMFRIFDDVAGGSYQYGEITIGTGASGIDTMLNSPSTILRMYKTVSGLSGLQWMVVGNEKCFWFGSKRVEGLNLWSFFFVGELLPAFPSAKPDLLPFVMVGSSSTGDYDFPVLPSASDASAFTNAIALGGPDGTLQPCNLCIGIDAQYAGAAVDNNWPAPNNGLMAYGRHVFYGRDSSGQSAVRGNGGIVLKGKLPGHLASLYLDNFEDGTTYPEFTVTFPGKTNAVYKLFRTRSEVAGTDPQHAFLFEVSDTWGW